MPAKKQITKEKILHTAVEIVRKSGAAALNMRALAHACKCSTQPIYLSFSGIEELQKEVAKEILMIFDNFIDGVVKEGKYPEYKAVGMGYVLFAKQEKQLYKFLFMEKHEKSGAEQGSFDQSVQIIMQNYSVSKEKAETLHLEMWMFVHGIASMQASGYIDLDMDTVSVMLTHMFTGLIKVIKEDNNDNRNQRPKKIV